MSDCVRLHWRAKSSSLDVRTFRDLIMQGQLARTCGEYLQKMLKR